MTYPTTVFDRPQWKLLPDPMGVRKYANVSNLLEIAAGSRVTKVALAVPTDLFTLMHKVLRVPPEAECSLSLDLQDGWYVFSLLVDGAEPKLYDLWAMTQKQLPTWMGDPAYRVR